MKRITKQMTATLVALLLLLSLTACGRDDKPSAGKSSESDRPQSSAEAETPGQTVTPAAPETKKTLDEFEARLIDYYVIDDRAYFCCAVETPPGHNLTCGLRVGGETSGAWMLMGDVPGWTVFFAESGIGDAPPLSDIQLSVEDYADGSKRLFGDWGEPAAPETYPEYSIYPVGDCYTLLGGGTLTEWKGEDYVDLEIQVPNLYLRDRDQLKVEDLTAEMFSLYAADGTPLEEAMGLPVKYSVRESRYDLLFKARFGETGCSPAGDELAKALEETAGYYVYHCADGNDYTIPFNLSK